jgi:8-oxo-dGTP diphosphatase
MSKIVCAAFISNQEVLLVRRSAHRKWSPERWDLVGGHVDRGEKVEDALIRECQEEVGLTPTSFTLLATVYEADDKSKTTPFYIYVVSEWSGGSGSLLGDEHSDLGWFSRRELDELTFALDDYRPILLKLLQAPIL